MLRIIKKYALLLLIAGVVIALDQWTKVLVRQYIPYGQMLGPDWLMPYARLINWRNTGVAFGMFQGMGAIFSILNLMIAAAIIYYYPRIAREDWPLRVALGLQLGGAIGNVIDRIAFGYVTDFISVGDFAVFNIADSAITVGVAVLILGAWLQERRKEKIDPSATGAEDCNCGDEVHE